VTVPPARAEEARAVMLELFPEGFEELDGADGLELAAYTNAGGEERIWQAFGGAASAEDIENGWFDRWRSFHHPVRVGALWVGPPWEEAPADALPVVIEPGRAFGTGGHATTRLCLELLQELPRGSVVDVGCGSGVLAIAAVRLGFAPVVALDSDPLAVEATTRNATANAVELECRLADATAAPLPKADLVVANITAASVERLARNLDAPLLLCSGYLPTTHPELPGFRRLARRELEGWAADLLAREG
jgi:ribosomal protein L11 methyltransferase